MCRRPALAAQHHAHPTIHRQPLPGDVFARRAGVQEGEAFEVFIVAQAAQRGLRHQAGFAQMRQGALRHLAGKKSPDRWR